jgi:hypothetical protein
MPKYGSASNPKKGQFTYITRRLQVKINEGVTQVQSWTCPTRRRVKKIQKFKKSVRVWRRREVSAQANEKTDRRRERKTLITGICTFFALLK